MKHHFKSTRVTTKKKKMLKTYKNFLFCGTFAICAIVELLPVCCTGQMGEPERWIRCLINFCLPPKLRRDTAIHALLPEYRVGLPNATV